MTKLAINLLPPEFTAQQFKRERFYKIQAAGVAVILIMVFLAAMTVALRFLQSGNIAKVSARLNTTEQKVSQLKDKQASLFLLRDRLAAIDQYLGVPSPQASMYKLIDKFIPPSVSVTGLTVDKESQVILTALVTDAETLDNLISDLTNFESSGENFSQVSIDSLTKGRDGLYRVSLKVKPKQK